MSFRKNLKKALRKCARIVTDPLTHKARHHVRDEYHKNLAECDTAQQHALMKLEAEYQSECKEVGERLKALEASKQEQEHKYQEEREHIRQYLADKEKAFKDTKELIQNFFKLLEFTVYACALGAVEIINIVLPLLNQSALLRNHFMAVNFLHIAADNNQIAILKLLSKVMDIHRKNEQGNTALAIVTERGFGDACAVLEAIAQETETFWAAVYSEDTIAMQKALAQGASINASLPNGYNILEQMIVDKKPYKLIRCLAEAGAYSGPSKLPLALQLASSHPDWRVRNFLEAFWEIDANVSTVEWTVPQDNPGLMLQNCLTPPARYFYQPQSERCTAILSRGDAVQFFSASYFGVVKYDLLTGRWSEEAIWQNQLQKPIQFQSLKTNNGQEQLFLLTEQAGLGIRLWRYESEQSSWHAYSTGPRWELDNMDIVCCAGRDTLYLLGRRGQTLELWSYAVTKDAWRLHPCAMSSVSNVKSIAAPQMSVVQLPSGEERLFILLARSVDLERATEARETLGIQVIVSVEEEAAAYIDLMSIQTILQQAKAELAVATYQQARIAHEQAVKAHAAYEQALITHQAAAQVAYLVEAQAKADAAQPAVFAEPSACTATVKLELWCYEPENQLWVLKPGNPWPETGISHRKVQMQALQVSGEPHLFFLDRYAEGTGLCSFNPNTLAWSIHSGCPQWPLPLSPWNAVTHDVLTLGVLAGHEHNTEMLFLSRQSAVGLESHVYHPGVQAWESIQAVEFASEALKLCDKHQGIEHHLTLIEQQYRFLILTAKASDIQCVTVPLNILALEHKLMSAPRPLEPQFSESDLLALQQFSERVVNSTNLLLKSAGTGDWVNVFQSLADGANINAYNEQGFNALQLALQSNVDMNTLKRLLQAGIALQGRNALEAQGVLQLAKDRKLEDVYNYLASLMERPMLVHDADMQAQFLQHYHRHLAKTERFLAKHSTELEKCLAIFNYYRLLSIRYPYAVYSLPALLILGELLSLPTEVLKTRTEALIALQQFFRETYAAHKALIAIGVTNLTVLSTLPHRDWTHVIAACVLKEEGIAYALAHNLEDTHLSVLYEVYQKQGDWLYKGMMCALQGFAKALELHPAQTTWLADVVQWLLTSQQQAPRALSEYYQNREKQSLALANTAQQAYETGVLSPPPKRSLEPSLHFIKTSENEVNKKIQQAEQDLIEEKESIEVWLAKREQEYLNCVQQLAQLIEETQGMNAKLRAQYQATLAEISTHFAEARAELHHNKEKALKRMRHQALKSIAIMIGTCVVANVFAPLITAAIGSATALGANASHILILEKIIKGAMMGGINATFAKQNILKAIIQGGGFAVLGCAINDMFGNLITVDMSRHYQSVNTAITSGMVAGIRVAIEHGDGRSIISTVGTGLLLDKLPFETATTGFLEDLRQNLVKSFIGGAIYAGITHEHFGFSVASAAVTAIACTAAEHVSQRIANPVMAHLFPETHQAKVRALENAKALAAAKSMQQEKSKVPATQVPAVQSAAMQKTQTPAVAESDAMEIRKAKTKINSARSKQKPKAPSKAPESARRYGVMGGDFEQELNDAHKTTENLLLNAKITETHRYTRGGLHSDMLPEDNALNLNSALFEPQTNVTKRAVLWQKPIHRSMENARSQRLSVSREGNASRRQIDSVDNSRPPKRSSSSTHAQSTRYHPIESELEGYTNGTKDVRIEEAILSFQKRRLQRELTECEHNQLSIENHRFFSPALQTRYENIYENTIERRMLLEEEYKKMQQLPTSTFVVWDKSPIGTEFSKLLSVKEGIASIDNELCTYVRQDLQINLTSVQSRLSLNYALQQRQERLRTGTELPWYKECAETFQMMTGVYVGASWTIAAGEMARHPGLALGAMAITMKARPLLTLRGLALYSGLSTAPAENLLRRGADYGLSSIGFGNPHTRDLLSTPVIEASKMVLTWGGVKATSPVACIAARAVRPSIVAVSNFVSERTFRSPLIMQYEPNKFYSGFPVDMFKPQKPWVKKDVLSEPARLYPSPLLQHEHRIIEQWTGERLNLLEKWEKEDISAMNKEMAKLAKKCHAQLRDHMTPNDLAAIMKEQRGVQIYKKEGGVFDHINGEWRQVRDSFENAFNGPWSGSMAEARILNERFGDLSRVWDRFEKLMERAKCTPEAAKLQN